MSLKLHLKYSLNQEFLFTVKGKLNYLINSVNITTNINEVDYFGFE